MQILINSDKNISIHAALSTSIEAEVHRLHARRAAPQTLPVENTCP